MLALPDESGSPLRRVSAGREHRGSASPRPQAAAASGLRLHRRRRRWRGHAEGKLPCVRGAELPAASGGRRSAVRSGNASARLGSRVTGAARARRLQPAHASWRRSRCGTSRRRRRHGVRSVDGFRTPDGRRESGFPRAGLVSALLSRRPRGRRGRPPTRSVRGFLCSGRHHRYGSARHARAGLSKRFERAPIPVIDVQAALSRSVVTWEDLRWIREVWAGPIVIKGVLTGDEARRAVDEGAAGVIVSNHGGRQLDGVPASIKALPEVVAAVNGRVEVLMDGGIRRGGDVVKAICLGARAVLVGRAYAWGLAAAGEAGVARALEILRADLERTLKLLGCASVAELDRSYVNVPGQWG